MDAPDAYKWCRKGDFILSTGFPFTENQKWETGMMNLLKILIEKKCAGIGIKLGRYVPYLTKELVSFADENNFPILSIPHEVKWADIIVPIVLEINKESQRKLELNQKVYNKFHNFLKNNGDLNELVKILRNIVNCPVTIYVRAFNKKIDSDETTFTDQDLEHIISTFSFGRNQTMQQLNMHNNNFTVRWITNLDRNKLEGGIFLWNPNSRLQTWEKIALEQAAVITALKIENIRSITTTYQRFRNDFLSKLISKNNIPESVIERRAKEVNWCLGNYNKVVLLDCNLKELESDNEKSIWRKKADVLEEFENALNRSSYENIPLGFDDKSRYVFFISEEIDQNAFINTINKTVARLNITPFYGGIGDFKSLNNLYTSYNQSEIALNVAYSKASNKKQRNILFVQNYQELHVERILFSENPVKEAKSLTTYLKKVMEYDINKNGELITTLKVFLANNSNYDDTAKVLFIHKNTVRYRINMIRDLTNLDPRKMEDKLILHMALTILDSQPIS